MMDENGSMRDIGIKDVDFDRLYQGGQLVDGLSFPSIPWDIGQAQPFVVDFERAGRFRSDVLDVGCGLGENASYLAGLGYQVVGVDASAPAIERAARRAAELGVAVEFAVADALSLADYPGRFGSILDSACYHCFGEDARHDYVAALYRASRPGALLNLCCFAPADHGMPAEMSVSEDNLRGTLGPAGWTITDLRRISYLTTGDLADVVRAAGMTATDLTADADGHLRMPVWAVQARRAD
jgi:SAM-dependent methyltransferase